jgi:toxin FitB
LTIYEVFKRVFQQRDEGDALRAVAVMQQGRVVDLDVRLALTAARLSVDTRLPMADSVVLATARLNDATLWTQDADFDSLPRVRYRPRKS